MCFCFGTPDLVELRRRGFVFALDGSTVTDQLELFRAYGQGLDAPNGYFGENWNAFSDCLLDLDWIEAHDVFVVHRELPHLSDEDTVIYLEILRHVTLTWADEETEKRHQLFPDFVPHRLTVFFPKDLEAMVLSLLGKSGP